jgi:hypothetical protein
LLWTAPTESIKEAAHCLKTYKLTHSMCLCIALGRGPALIFNAIQVTKAKNFIR